MSTAITPLYGEAVNPYYGAPDASDESKAPTRRWSTLSMETGPRTPTIARRASLMPVFTSRRSHFSTSGVTYAPPPTSPTTTPALSISDELSSYSSHMNLLLQFTFLGLLGYVFGLSDAIVFVLVFLGMVPLAMLLGKATEDIGEHTNETIGALVNITFGNAVELILSIIALRAGKIQLIQDTIIGSILSNLLLVLGSAFFFGGLQYKEQVVLAAVCEANADLLAFAVFSFSVPALFATAVPAARAAEGVEEKLSLVTSICLLMIYGMYMYFQLVTHADLYSDANSEAQSPVPNFNAGIGSEGDLEEATMNRIGSDDTAPIAVQEGERKLPSLRTAMLLLSMVVVLVICSSEVLVRSLDGFSANIGLSTKFIAIILIPVIGNAVEHMSAVFVARHNKIDLSVGIACGSSLQIALFAAPLLVVISWLCGYEHLTLNFQLFDTICMGFTVLVVNATMRDSRTNWLEGAVLVVCYFILATAFFFID